MKTPAELGYRHPAEWEPHAATWIGWPHNVTDWPGKIAPIHWVYGEIVRKIAPGERVRILVQSAPHEARAQRVLSAVGVDLSRMDFFRIPTDRGWTRDSGPIFVKARDKAIVHFRFNAWAKYNDWRRDAKMPAAVAKKLGYRIFSADFCLEGGAIDTNGEGTLLTTEECLLDAEVQVRNPGLDRVSTEAKLREYLGVRKIVWLGKGIAGDDTHGHVDDLCRFVNRKTVVLCGEPGHDNHERLQGTGLDVVALPMPAPLHFRGRRLPASYANFYIANAAVIVPTFNDPNDRVALGILGELFRDRPVVGIHAVDLVWGLGTLHCLTQQEPGP